MERTTPHHPIQQHLGLTPSNTISPITRTVRATIVPIYEREDIDIPYINAYFSTLKALRILFKLFY